MKTIPGSEKNVAALQNSLHLEFVQRLERKVINKSINALISTH